MTKYPVVVIRSNDNCFLDVIRCCGIAHIPVIPVVFSWKGAGPWWSEHSCYFQNPVRITNPAEDETQAINDLISLGKHLIEKYGIKILIIPTSDTSHVLLQYHFEELADYYLQMGHRDLDKDCLSIARKDTFAILMMKHEVDIPISIPCLKPEDIDKTVQSILYPCVYKPIIKDTTNSFYSAHNRLKAIECKDSVVLKKALNEELAAGFELLVQEKIFFENPEDEYSCYIYCDKDGNIRMVSGQYKLDEYPKPYGTGFISRFYYHRELFEIAVKVIQAMDWHGFVGIEFMKDMRDGKWKVIEANIRPWLSIYFQAHAGYNYIEMLYKDAYGLLEPYSGVKFPPTNLESEIFRINFSVFWDMLVKSNKSSGILSALTKWFEDHPGKYVFTNYVNHDPMPGIIELENLKEKTELETSGIITLLLSFIKSTNETYYE